MRLVVATPMTTIVDTDRARHVRAEDATGEFGLLARHGDFVTVLAISIVTWRDVEDREHHVAVRGGILMITGGEVVEIATPDAHAADDLVALEHEVVARYRADAEASAALEREARRLEVAIARQVLRYLRSDARLPMFVGEGER